MVTARINLEQYKRRRDASENRYVPPTIQSTDSRVEKKFTGIRSRMWNHAKATMQIEHEKEISLGVNDRKDKNKKKDSLYTMTKMSWGTVRVCVQWNCQQRRDRSGPNCQKFSTIVVFLWLFPFSSVNLLSSFLSQFTAWDWNGLENSIFIHQAYWFVLTPFSAFHDKIKNSKHENP